MSEVIEAARQAAREAIDVGVGSENRHLGAGDADAAADAAVRVVLDGLEMALKPRDEVDADGMPYRYRPSAVRVIDDLRAELRQLEHSPIRKPSQTTQMEHTKVSE